jgi:hypothetical protein
MIALWILFIGGALLSGILELQYLGGEADTSLVLGNVMSPPILDNALTAVVEIVIYIKDLFLAILNALWWNYAFFSGDWQIIKWLICMPISFGIVWSIIMAIRGTSSG